MSVAQLGPLALGTVLNPLNSSMIAVALVPIQRHFGVSITTATWVISAFYLAASIGQPLMGRFADRFGPRRVFAAGMVLVAIAALMAPFSPSFWVLVGWRVVQSVGTSTAYPSAMAMMRHEHSSRGPTVVATANTLGAALGPVLGGALVLVGGWEAIFWVNLPLSLLAIVACLTRLPTDGPARAGSASAVLRAVDLPGVTAFAAMMIALLVFVLSFSGTVRWWAAPVLVVAGAAFAWWELRAPEPFIDLRRLWRHRDLLGTYGQFIIFNLAYYGAFYGLPQWLEDSRGYSPAAAGLLLLPIAGVGAIATALTPRLIRHWGIRATLLLGSCVLTLGFAGVRALGGGTPATLIVVVGILLGIPYGLNNLGLQHAMNTQAPPSLAGVAAGLFQTSRYIGAIAATSVLGLLFGNEISDPQLHDLAWFMVAVSAVLVVISVVALRGTNPARRPE